MRSTLAVPVPAPPSPPPFVCVHSSLCCLSWFYLLFKFQMSSPVTRLSITLSILNSLFHLKSTKPKSLAVVQERRNSGV